MPLHLLRFFYQYLIQPDTVIGPIIQTSGAGNITNATRIKFSPSGTKLLSVSYTNNIELFDFDRCSGIISNPRLISPNQFPNVDNFYFGSSFSPNENFIYVSNVDNAYPPYDAWCLEQYDITQPTGAAIAATKTYIFNDTIPASGGQHKLGPDGKIYITFWYKNWEPYDDSMRNMYNENLSVIEFPDSPGVACSYQPFSFYLAGKRTYLSLPNNPNYELGAWAGSPCDTLTASPPAPQRGELATLQATCNGQKLIVNAAGLKGTDYILQITDAMGKVLYSLKGKTQPPYFFKEINCRGWSNGVYFVLLQTEKEKLSAKFVKQ